MEIDIKKVSQTPKDKWEAIDLLVKSQQDVTEALHIMISALENNDDELKDFHQRRMTTFVKKFIKSNN